jgi:hypothetical protein
MVDLCITQYKWLRTYFTLNMVIRVLTLTSLDQLLLGAQPVLRLLETTTSLLRMLVILDV